MTQVNWTPLRIAVWQGLVILQPDNKRVRASYEHRSIVTSLKREKNDVTRHE
jgi:hypothetical protein